MSVINFAERQNIELIFDTEEEELYCEIDIECIERVMLNLLSNAIKYNKKNGTIDVIIKNDEEHIYVEVIDSGIGIPKDSLDRIFERFYRVDKSHSRASGGTGLRLSIVKHAVLYHGGKLFVESTLGKCSTIGADFPLSMAD